MAPCAKGLTPAQDERQTGTSAVFPSYLRARAHPWRCLYGLIHRQGVAGFAQKRGNTMRMWLLLILLVCVSGALYLGFGSHEYSERSSEIVSQLENL